MDGSLHLSRATLLESETQILTQQIRQVQMLAQILSMPSSLLRVPLLLWLHPNALCSASKFQCFLFFHNSHSPNCNSTDTSSPQDHLVISTSLSFSLSHIYNILPSIILGFSCNLINLESLLILIQQPLNHSIFIQPVAIYIFFCLTI